MLYRKRVARALFLNNRTTIYRKYDGRKLSVSHDTIHVTFRILRVCANHNTVIPGNHRGYLAIRCRDAIINEDVVFPYGNEF